MSTQADKLGERVIVMGRAYVQMIKVVDDLLDHGPVRTDLQAPVREGEKP